MQYRPQTAAPHTVISSSGKHYAPLTRPSTASSVNVWRPTTTASGRASLEMSKAAISVKHENPRYAHIEAKTDTGPNMRKIEERFGITNVRYKRTECFRRIKPEKLAHELRAGNVQDVLLLDLREKEEFDALHIRDAHSYPASMMSRSMYNYTPEILECKNKQGKLMVLYDLEEKLSTAVGNNWYEKGIDNFVVMTGGLLALARTHPDLIEGVLPTHLLAPQMARRTTGSTRRPTSASAGPAGSASGSGGAGGAGAKHMKQQVELHVGLQNVDANRRPTTAGMASATCATRSVPRPVAWNSLRDSAAMPAQGGSFYVSRSFDSRASLR